ncbi:MAG: cytochrome P450 [Acetobacteraceae bacterium]|nr:cytochrome P450 [Acetobacteraceae bacterium]
MMAAADPLRPAEGGVKARLTNWALGQAPLAFRVLREVWPIPRAGRMALVTRHDDVREVFLRDADFGVTYRAKLDVIMGGEPFFLGMPDGEAYRRAVGALRLAVPHEDIPARLAPAFERRAEEVVREAGGRIEVVDALVRRISFEALLGYFGIAAPADGDLRVWATRLFEFQFADPGDDPALRAEVDDIAPRLRAHIDGLIRNRRGSGPGPDDVLGRCLALQAEGKPGFADAQIRSGLIGLVVGGPPQQPMIVPQALEQLLRRPEALAGAIAAARAGDDALVAGHVFEAMRFDPIAPALPRVATRDCTIAAGTGRAATIAAGTAVFVGLASAMRDRRRIADPEAFDPRRPPHDYMHFGHGLHECFAAAINRAVLPLLLKPLLRRGVRRADGPEGRLRKRGPFAERLVVEYDRA